jgi:bacteriorhodopsin
MSLGLGIYLAGCVIAFVICILICRKEDKTIERNELAIAIVFALCSWITVIALWFGWNIKYGQK